MAKLEGYKKFLKKDQSGMCYVITYSFDNDAPDQIGRGFKDVFVSETVFNQLKPDMCGKPVSFDYDLDRGYPRIVGVSVSAVDKKG